MATARRKYSHCGTSGATVTQSRPTHARVTVPGGIEAQLTQSLDTRWPIEPHPGATPMWS